MKELIERAIQINEELVAKLKELKELEEPNLLGADVTNFKLWNYLPKEGEYFYVKTKDGDAFIAIAKNGEDLTSRFVSLNQDNGELRYNGSGRVCSEPSIKELRPATTQEIAFLDTKLKEKGKYFDKESMSIKEIVNEPAFKKGDWVLITKPKNVRQKPTWSPNMDKYDGQTVEIEEIDSDSYLVIDGWKFHPNWCTKAEAPKLKVDDLYIFWNYEKTDAVIGKLTGINKSDIPYEVGSMWSYVHCIKFESMEQYNKFIEE